MNWPVDIFTDALTTPAMKQDAIDWASYFVKGHRRIMVMELEHCTAFEGITRLWLYRQELLELSSGSCEHGYIDVLRNLLRARACMYNEHGVYKGHE